MIRKAGAAWHWGVAATASLMAGATPGLGEETSPPRDPRPNIVFLYADDLGYGDLGSYGSEHAVTPHLDQLAEDGTRFTQFYVSHCVCSPTRASALTGHFPSRHCIFGHLATLENNANRNMPNWIHAEAPSMPAALQKAGYRTAMIGKWHLGGGSGRFYQGKAINDLNAPSVESYGFDYARTEFGNSATWKDAEPVPEPHDIYPYDDKGWQRWSSKAIADDAIRFVEKHQDEATGQPFYMNVWFKDPHTPYDPTEEMLEPFEHLPEPSRAHYAMIRFMDEQIGRILACLEEQGLRDRTLVLFSSDNGAVEGRGGSSGPLRGWKWYLYEGGIRVPLIVRWPGHVPAGRVDERSVMNIVDFTPTFSGLAGATMPSGYEPDGVDLIRAWRGEAFERTTPMFWHHPTAPQYSPTLAIRSGSWKLIMDPDGGRLALYNLDSDPGETTDRSGTEPGVVADLRETLEAWYGTLPAEARRFTVDNSLPGRRVPGPAPIGGG